jgi:hypothetical protein
MTTGPSLALLIQKSDAKDTSVDQLRELISSDESLKEAVDCTQSTENTQQ